jgi:hypothetical protein
MDPYCYLRWNVTEWVEADRARRQVALQQGVERLVIKVADHGRLAIPGLAGRRADRSRHRFDASAIRTPAS